MKNAKKICALFLIGGIAMASATAQTLVAYFSATGNTERLARTIAEALGADLFKIEPSVPYTSADLNWRDNSSRSTVEGHDSASRPAIARLPDVSRYNTIVLAFPIWWYGPPKILYTFAERVNLSGKRIVPVCTSGSSGIGNSARQLAAVSSPSAEWLSGTRFNSSASASEVRRFFDSVLN